MKRIAVASAFALFAILTPQGASAQPAGAVDPVRIPVGFLKLNVMDLLKMQTFYEKAFGMQQLARFDNDSRIEVVLRNPNGADVALVYSKETQPITVGNAHGPIGFYLHDVDTAYVRVMAAGATSLLAPRSRNGVRLALLKDPEGHELELLDLD